MKAIAKKIRSKAGESLVESLAAVLIFTLASIGLFSMIQASNNINRTAREKDAFVQQQMIETEKADTAQDTGTAAFTIKDQDGATAATEKINVEIFGDTADGLFSYFKKR